MESERSDSIKGITKLRWWYRLGSSGTRFPRQICTSLCVKFVDTRRGWTVVDVGERQQEEVWWTTSNCCTRRNGSTAVWNSCISCASQPTARWSLDWSTSGHWEQRRVRIFAETGDLLQFSKGGWSMLVSCRNWIPLGLWMDLAASVWTVPIVDVLWSLLWFVDRTCVHCQHLAAGAGLAWQELLQRWAAKGNVLVHHWVVCFSDQVWKISSWRDAVTKETGVGWMGVCFFHLRTSQMDVIMKQQYAGHAHN